MAFLAMNPVGVVLSQLSNSTGTAAFFPGTTCDAGFKGPSCQYSDAVTCNSDGEVAADGSCSCNAIDAGPTCLTNVTTFHLDLPGIAGLGLYDHQFYHAADRKVDYLVHAIEFFTDFLLLSNMSATAHRGNVRIEIEPTYFNAYGSTQLDTIASNKWPFANSYVVAWKLFNGTFEPHARKSGQLPPNAYADAAYVRVRLLGAKVNIILADDTKTATFVADIRQLVTRAMVGSDPNSTTCQMAENKTQQQISSTAIEPWCMFGSETTVRQFQAAS
jgi:hypothetical protein